MSFFSDYDLTAGFPKEHIAAFKDVAKQLRMVISSRELNPCSTDLVLEGYATKGFHIKAKTCDWGPGAGFVVDDSRFTRSASSTKQTNELKAAFQQGATSLPLFISDERFTSLRTNKVVHVTGSREPEVVPVIADPVGSPDSYRFVLVRSPDPLKNDKGKRMWGVYYDPSEKAVYSENRRVCPLKLPLYPALNPVMAMVNPRDRNGTRLGVKSAAAGDYDLWCIFAHRNTPSPGINNRPMQLRSTLLPKVQPLVTALVMKGHLVYRKEDDDKEWNDALKKENPHLGNISLAVMKVKAALNLRCNHPGGDVVQHNDFGGNPFGTIDYPLIFFVPNDDCSDADMSVVRNLLELKGVLKKIARSGFVVKLNPAWSVPSY